MKKKIKTFVPIITPFDKKNNIDYFSLEKFIIYISNIEEIKNIILFSNCSEYNFISNNEKIDIINCINNTLHNNINIYLKISNLYHKNDILNIINQNIYKNIYYFIIDYPYLNKSYNKEIINNYNKIFKEKKYLNFYFTINNNLNIDEKIFLKIKEKNKNFIGVINKSNFFFKNYNLIKNIKIIIYNDINFFNNLIININGIISPLFNILFKYIYINIIKKINNNKIIVYDYKFFKFLKLINILYKKMYFISGLKYLLNINNICNFYVKLPCNNINNNKYYKKLKKIYKYIILKNEN
ncbi:MAG: dihydrodipicolinate synthase family protein [Candidatus Shikimatogenerans bostrichidophilus]|nr:MAG: dihydrodipicolinate synthase family protein [Candidatus Shikimatogenerans bostrichidophilus]